MTLKSSLLVILGVLFLLTGCSKFSIPGSQLFNQKSSRPAPLKALKPVTTSINATSAWQVSTGSAMGENKVHPYIDSQSVYVAGGSSASSWQKSSGKQQWKAAIGETVSAGVNGSYLPRANNGSTTSNAQQIFIGTISGNAIALDAKTGKVQWIERLSSEVLSVSPSLNNRVVFRTIDGKLHGLASNTGELIWQRSQATPALSQLGASVPVIASNLVIAGFDNGKVAAYNLQDGQGVWQVTLALPRGNTELEQMIDVDGKIKTLGNALFAASLNGSNTGINMESGQQAWSKAFSTPTGVNADSQALYSSDDKGNIWKFDPRTGDPVWSIDDLQGRHPSVPALVGSSNIVVADQQGNIHWIDATKGVFVGRNKGDSRGYSVEPEAFGNQVYTIGRSGILNKFTLQ